MKRDNRGFTLIEMIVVMAVFVVIIAIAGDSFKLILTQASKVFRSEESNIEGIVGLEIIRHDLQQAGFGLFTEPPPVNYSEAAAIPASNYNDAPSNVPRAILAGNNLAAVNDAAAYGILAGTDYLVVKATSVGRNRTSQKWTYLKFSPTGVTPNIWPSAAENFTAGGTGADRVVLLRRNIDASQSILQSDPAGDFYYAYSNTAFNNYTSSSSAVFTAYGLNNGPTTPRMPFNRADFFVAQPPAATQVAPLCAPNSGTLYKTTVENSAGSGGGGLNYVPLMDCVADMQIVLGWDMDGDGAVDTYSNADGSSVNGTGTIAAVQAALQNPINNTAPPAPSSLPASIRGNLKMVKVYILAQQGRIDRGYTSPSPIIVGDGGEASITRSYDITAAGWQNYRWKLYRIVARPKNLSANQ